jgi:peptidoglycan/LPS O-acetylase OafA/YrhL
VEEQFDLIFPSMWVLTAKAWRGRLFLGVFLLLAAWNLTVVKAGWDSLMSSRTRTGFACICCGVLIAIYEARLRAIANRVPSFLVAMVALMLLLCHLDLESVKEAVYESLFVPPAIGLMLLFSLGRGGWLGTFLCCKPVQAVGLTSYGIYLWQQLFTAPKAHFFAGSMQPYFSEAGEIIPMLLPLLCLIVPLSYFLIEKPAMSYGKSLLYE